MAPAPVAPSPAALLPIAQNEDRDTCRRCAGKCCKTLPGAFLPGQLDDDALREGLASGALVVAWWEGDPRPEVQCFDVDCDGACARCLSERLMRAYYVRPRNANSPHGVHDPSPQGACLLLGPDGCTLPFESRPAGCQNLLVNKEDPGNCHEYAVPTGSFRHYAALAWVPHQERLANIVRNV